MRHHVTTVLDYPIQDDSISIYQEATDKEYLSLIQEHSNKYSQITSIKRIESESGMFEIGNHKLHSRIVLDVRPQRLTHYINCVILGATKEHRVREAVDMVEEIIVFIGKDNTVRHVITFVRRDEIKSSYIDFLEPEISEKELVIMLSQCLELAEWMRRQKLAYPSFDKRIGLNNKGLSLKLHDLTYIRPVISSVASDFDIKPNSKCLFHKNESPQEALSTSFYDLLNLFD